MPKVHTGCPLPASTTVYPCGYVKCGLGNICIQHKINAFTTMSSHQAFIDKVITKTAQGRIPWKAMSESDAFTASIEQEFTLTVRRPEAQEFSFEVRDRLGNRLLDLTGEKSQAWEQGYEQAVEDFERLRQLFEAARRFALDVDNQLLRANTLLDQC
ncbi:MAG: hypothetical protein AB7O65_13620 [Candidatus Korobacteraceae bacterium]